MNMLQVIARSAAGSDHPAPCPFCGTDPPLAAQIAGRFIVGCESDECAANPQVSGSTVGAAWERWNLRAPFRK